MHQVVKLAKIEQVEMYCYYRDLPPVPPGLPLLLAELVAQA
ncbi:hypothetical protein C900_01114 [Fulvivirga imtechensis AK7]|uniref:Uncharacterized protein n=1 Tax=Fulvivirga imtechensis AK7 TaxID=1237149 RepID=L8JVD6_9BACT|nr:hypothetical protein C900_01114 [Fulvivirga imtechensis AK7]